MADGEPSPVLVEVVRSGFVESVHRGALVVTAPDGTVRVALGDVDRPVFPRSANKPLQALGMLNAGLRVTDDALALVCASHSGEAGHVARALAMLEQVGLGEADLHCPPEPRRAAMNCSGKHAGMLTACVQRGWATAGYTDPAHELQRTIAATIEELTGEPIAATGVDGCGAPLFAFSLTGLARAFSSASRTRVGEAMRTHPWLVAGTGREDTLLMLAVPGLLTKGGAEGVHAMALPDGSAVALKIDDGAGRGRAPLLVAALRASGSLPQNPAARAVLDGLGNAAGTVLGGGREVGELRVSRHCLAVLETALESAAPATAPGSG
ncbi:L-asparaginase II [Saccharomonospora marina XMU15]|uniref:L-asparaginase II n=1 Tax=Saccharomonospora marina XMU15 TaxID=882083 RepID=H5X931_9PSEU|nr:asparaginase [Saccharomonospora marina]EHR53634.1 L-asparaginase II [Saccharomonospora marina XMU15]